MHWCTPASAQTMDEKIGISLFTIVHCNYTAGKVCEWLKQKQSKITSIKPDSVMCIESEIPFEDNAKE